MKSKSARILTSSPYRFEPVTKEIPLTEGDKKVLFRLWQTKTAYIGLTYLSLVGVLILAIIQGYLKAVRSNLEQAFFHVFPFFSIGAFSLLTYYFIRFYKKEANGYRKDFLQGFKREVAFAIVKHEMAVFSKYFVRTPIESRQLIQVNREDFDFLPDHGTLVFEIFPESNHIHKLRFNDRDIPYFG